MHLVGFIIRMTNEYYCIFNLYVCVVIYMCARSHCVTGMAVNLRTKQAAPRMLRSRFALKNKFYFSKICIFIGDIFWCKTSKTKSKLQYCRLSIANAKAGHVVITTFRKWKGPELRVFFFYWCKIHRVFVKMTSWLKTWNGWHTRETTRRFEGHFLLYLVRKSTSTIGWLRHFAVCMSTCSSFKS